MPNFSASALRAGLRSTPTIMFGAGHARALDHVEADAAEAEHDHVVAGLTLAVLITAPMPVVTPQPM
jgi:hypothetical protein